MQLFLNHHNVSVSKLHIFAIVVVFGIFYSIPVYAQFADLPQDAKTVDIGVNGDRTSQALILTAVVPIRDINGWVGIFGSRASSEGEVLSTNIFLGGMSLTTHEMKNIFLMRLSFN